MLWFVLGFGPPCSSRRRDSSLNASLSFADVVCSVATCLSPVSFSTFLPDSWDRALPPLPSYVFPLACVLVYDPVALFRRCPKPSAAVVPPCTTATVDTTLRGTPRIAPAPVESKRRPAPSPPTPAKNSVPPCTAAMASPTDAPILPETVACSCDKKGTKRGQTELTPIPAQSPHHALNRRTGGSIQLLRHPSREISLPPRNHRMFHGVRHQHRILRRRDAGIH